jgi:hypothetical protein
MNHCFLMITDGSDHEIIFQINLLLFFIVREQFRIESVLEVGTHAMTEFSVGMIGYVSFNLIPVVFIVPDFFASRADRHSIVVLSY